jgi:hypothetical protein
LPLTLEDTINVDRRLPELIDIIRTIGDQPAIGDMESSVAGSLYRAARLIINLRWTGDAPPAVMIGRFQFQLDSHRRDPHLTTFVSSAPKFSILRLTPGNPACRFVTRT